MGSNVQKAGRAAAGVRGRTPLGNREAFRARMADLKEMWRAGNRPLPEPEEAPPASVSSGLDLADAWIYVQAVRG